jgi:hypothetical protein
MPASHGGVAWQCLIQPVALQGGEQGPGIEYGYFGSP